MADNATRGETLMMGLKLWGLALAVTLFLPFVLVAMTVMSLFGAKLPSTEQIKDATMPRGPWS